MTNVNVAELTQRIERLDAERLEKVYLYVELLIQPEIKVVHKSKRTKKQKNLLADMKHIPVPVDGYILNRADIYEDYIEF